MRWTALLGALAVTASLLLPPLGVALGILVVVRALLVRPVLRRARLSAAAVVGPVLSGVIAIAIGSLMTVVLALYWPELTDYRDCMAGANTTIAEEACTTQLGETADLPSWLVDLS